MPTRTGKCLARRQIDQVSTNQYILINSVHSENKLPTGYQSRFETKTSDHPLINNHVRKKCYIKVTRNLPSIRVK